ncbi:MAG: NusG domain II-containing protein [Ruminococcaceae bacterium]|nr:NusG domain II-containing protein [Oscillospiraceae bacterium]
MSNKKKIKNDIILAVIVLVIAAGGILLLNIFRTEGAFAVVKIDGAEAERYPLSVNTEAVIETGDNKEFKNTLVIEDGKAFIRDANCPDKICEGHNKISYKGETIVCLPHKVVIEIVAEDTADDLDVVV